MGLVLEKNRLLKANLQCQLLEKLPLAKDPEGSEVGVGLPCQRVTIPVSVNRRHGLGLGLG